jgi:hypothetical protein
VPDVKALQGIQFAHDHRRLPACRMEKNFPPAAEIDREYQKSLFKGEVEEETVYLGW